MGDFSLGRDPDKGVFHFLSVRGDGFVDADGDGEIVLFCAILQTEDEFRGCDWLA